MEWAPGKVRQEILDGHGLLRETLAQLEAVLERVKAGDAAAAATLPDAVGQLQQQFGLHMTQEEAVLRPVLLAVDSWGAVRAERLRQEHDEQRQRLTALREAWRAGASSGAVALLRTFMAELRSDMAEEEKEFLRADLLKDDPITVGFIG